MTRSDLMLEIEMLLSEFVPGDSRRGPSEAMLRKTDTTLAAIMALIDSFLHS